MKLNVLVKLCFFILGTNVYAQNVVVDSITKKPIEAVHISYNVKNGLITNSDGYFELPESTNTDSIFLSHISYKSKKVDFKNFKSLDTIYLESNAVSLDQVILKSFAVTDTIRKAIEKIDANYLNVPHNSYGFFRQSMQENGKGIEMIEVDFVSYLEDRQSNYTTNITNAERTKNYSSIKFNTVGGVYVIIEKGDFVKRKDYFLNKDKVANYVFQYEGMLTNDGVNIYKIGFTPKDNNDLRSLRSGELYLEAASLAFMEINYTMDQSKLNKINELSNAKLDKRKPLFFTKRIQSSIKYKQLNKDKWVLSSIEVQNDKEGVSKKERYLYSLIARIIINKVDIDDVKKVETNFKVDKDFSKAVRRIDRINDWNDTYKYPLSTDEKRILKEIIEQKDN